MRLMLCRHWPKKEQALEQALVHILLHAGAETFMLLYIQIIQLLLMLSLCAYSSTLQWKLQWKPNCYLNVNAI